MVVISECDLEMSFNLIGWNHFRFYSTKTDKSCLFFSQMLSNDIVNIILHQMWTDVLRKYGCNKFLIWTALLQKIFCLHIQPFTSTVIDSLDMDLSCPCIGLYLSNRRYCSGDKHHFKIEQNSETCEVKTPKRQDKTVLFK